MDIPPKSPESAGKPEPRPAAAVALIRLGGPDPHYLVLRRTVNPADPWSGHFALPGGRRESMDRTLLDTCIRETREECGVCLEPGQMVRALPWASAGMGTDRATLVAPYLFEIRDRPRLALATLEISESHWLPLSYLRDPANHDRAPLSPLHPGFHFPCIKVGTGAVWGFTYGLLKSHVLDALDAGAFPEGKV